MKFEEIVTGIISGTAGGLIVWGLQQWYLNSKEKNKKLEEKVIKAKHLDKQITDNVLSSLRPGTSIELMRDTLGVPTKFSKVDYPIFCEEQKATSSYLFSFQNAYVKITSEDNQTIDSITVLPHDNSFQIDGMVYPCESSESRLNKIKVCPELISSASNHTLLHTRIDFSFALQKNIANPLYQCYTFFGYAPEDSFEYHKTKDPFLFDGGLINGICIANSENNSFYIYDYECR